MDALGNPVMVMLSGGQVHDSKAAIPILSQISIAGSVIQGDKAFGSQEIRDYIIGQKATYAIPPKDNNPNPWECDWWQYKERHLVECFFNKLKNFRRVATRYDKLASRFLSFVHLACAVILLR